MCAFAVRLGRTLLVLGALLISASSMASVTINSPNPGSQLQSDSLTLEWADSNGSVSSWWVYAGNALGKLNYVNSGALPPSTSTYTLNDLPENGSDIHVRLWYLIPGSAWAYEDVLYTSNDAVTPPELTSPATGTSLTASEQLFEWTARTTEVDQWWFYAGSALAGKQYYNSGLISDSAVNQHLVTNLPTDGSDVHARLWYRKSGQSWQFLDSIYQTESTAASPPELTEPASGETLSKTSTEALQWTSNNNAIDQWWVYVGSTIGGKQYFDSGAIAGATTNVEATSIPNDGSLVHIRLWYKSAGQNWKKIDYSFTAHLAVPSNLTDYDLVFADEFNGASLDSAKWNSGFLWGPYLPINDEEQLYIDKLGMHQNHAYDPFTMTGTSLKIKAEPVSTAYSAPEMPAINDPVWSQYLEYRHNEDYDPANVNYLSGILTSYESFQFTHGYIEARVKFPAGQGLWPAFWLLNGYYVEDSPEIDIVESLGQNASEVYQTYHYFDVDNGWAKISTPTFTTPNATATTQFHTYGASWEAGQIIWYVDGVETYRVSSDSYEISKQSMYVLLNMAVGGVWPGSPDASTTFPAEYEVDYVRVYQKKSLAPITASVLEDDYQIMFSDEFDGATLDPTKWNTSFLWGPYLPINNEEQYYVDSLGSDQTNSYSPFDVSSGTLKIKAEMADQNPGAVPATLPAINDPIWTEYPSYQRNQSYSPPEITSGVITSYDAFKFVNGYAETRAKIPAGDGLWPAFWLLNGYYVGPQPEIDVLEVRGENPMEAVHSYHYYNSNGELVSTDGATTSSNPPLGYADDFHTYGVSWEPGKIVWYIDGVDVHTVTDSAVSTQLMYVLANLAVGGNFNTVPVDPDALPATLEIDYIRVYQRKDTE